MTYSGNDIDIFVFTYNRAHLLDQTIQNLLCQTEPGIRICVLDNASVDNTEEIAQKFYSHGVQYFRGDINGGWHANFERAKLLSSRDWIMLFHDDDFLHPNYCKFALDQINNNEEVVLVLAPLTFEASPNNDWDTSHLISESNRCDIKQFASTLYKGVPLSFGSAIYKADLLKYINLDFRYGKVGDRPLMLKVAENGKTIVFINPLVKYRIHENQDSQFQETGPYACQLAALHALYFQYMGDSLFDSSGRVFLLNNYQLLKNEYDRLGSIDRNRFKSFFEYWLFILSEGGASNLARSLGLLICFLRLGYILNKLTLIKKYLKLLLKWLKANLWFI